MNAPPQEEKRIITPVGREQHNNNDLICFEDMSNRRMRSGQNKQTGSRLARGLKGKERRKRQKNTLANAQKTFTGVGKYDNERRDNRRSRGRGRGRGGHILGRYRRETDRTQ